MTILASYVARFVCALALLAILLVAFQSDSKAGDLPRLTPPVLASR